MRPRAVFVVALGASACGDNLLSHDPLALPVLVDTNPDPDIVEVELVAAVATTTYVDGVRTELWGYRDGSVAGSKVSVPGPTLEVPLGSRVIVHFRNELAEPTTIHWHGIRVPNDADGSEHTQNPVQPGGSYDYVYSAIDSGTYWYHPHIRGDVQLEKGLYGAVVIRDRTEPAVHADRVLILDDIKLTADGRLDDSVELHDIHFGRMGNTVLVNGKAGATLEVQAGARERWRFVNAANGRFFQLALPGHPFLVIAWDGGVIAEPYTTDTLLISPGERYEVIVDLPASGEGPTLQTLYYQRALDLPDPGPLDLLNIELGAPAPEIGALPSFWAAPIFIPTDAQTPVRHFVLHEDPGPDGTKVFSINGEVYPAVTPILAEQGEIEIWQINDDVGMDHPFHLHGMFFQVLDVDGVPPAHQGWKDTVIIPRYKTLRFAVRQGTPGHWMYHCHILEHQERGMMGVLTVE